MDEKKDRTIVLRSFSNIKNVDIKVYRIGNIKLWQPISIEALCCFCVCEFVMVILNAIVTIPVQDVIKFLAIPVGLAYVVKTAKIDGKKPHIYFLRLLQYQKIKNKTIERFEVKDDIKEIEFK